MITYYQELLGSSNALNETSMRGRVPGWLLYSLISLSNKSFFSLGSDIAPGSDRFTALFFKEAWSMVNDIVVGLLTLFCRSRKLLREINSNIITLVPKIPNPSNMSDFRPIACWNVIYKCITKNLAKRLRWCLKSLVSSNQIAFIKGRNISENVLLWTD